MDRESILAGLRHARTTGRALLAVGAGTGGVALAAEKGGADLIVVYNSGMYRSHGVSSLSGMLPYGDANAIVMEMGAKIIPAAPSTPVLAGVCGTDPFRAMPRFLREVRDLGFAGVQNFPTVGLIDGQFRRDLESTGIRFQQEVEMIAEARALGLLTCAFVCDEQSAVDMASVGADIVAPHLGVSIAGGSLEDAVDRIQAMTDAVAAVSPEALVLFHGGPATTPAEVQYLLDKLARVDGYFGASSIERQPVIDAVERATREFAAIAVEFDSATAAKPEMQLDSSNLPRYLADHRLVNEDAPVEIEELGGGISNVLVRYRSGDRVGVLKQARPQILVEQEWLCDVRRILVEREAIEVVTELLPAGTVPQVTFHDDTNFVFVMTSAPDAARLWKTDLMSGDIATALFSKAGAMLARIHSGTAQNNRLRKSFGVAMLSQLRIEPYFQATALKHPDLAAQFKAAMRVVITERNCLVHGDYVPKNMLVTGADDLMLLDFEIVHYGNPAYDLATFINHILLKSIAFDEQAARYVDAARAFRNAYVSAGGLPIIEDDVLLLLGCLMLARVDGKSPVEYLTAPQKEFVRTLAREVLTGRLSSVDEVFAHRINPQESNDKEVEL